MDNFEKRGEPKLMTDTNLDQFYEGKTLVEATTRLVQELRKLKITSTTLNTP